MRINVYAEELPDLPKPDESTVGKRPPMEVVIKTVNQQLFYGIRLYLKSAPELHYGNSDDDRSAITFWVPWTKAKGNDPTGLLLILNQMYDDLVLFASDRGDIGE